MKYSLTRNRVFGGLLAAGLSLALSLGLPAVQAAGLLTPADGSLPPLSIRSHDVVVTVEDGFAVTEVTQVFHNPHDRDLEAIYSFPVPEHGSVAEFTVWIDGNPVVGEVLRKEKARQVYEEEKAFGREAGLAEKDDYRTFDISVHPVWAGQETRVRFVYLQPATVDHGVGRYVYPLEEGGVDEQKLAFWTSGEAVENHFSFDFKLRSGYPVQALRLPQHPAAVVESLTDGEWRARLVQTGGSAVIPAPATDLEQIPGIEPKQAGGTAAMLNEDLVVYWRHKSGLPGRVEMVSHKAAGEARGTFLLALTPGEDLLPAAGSRDWVFVLDRSGSMGGKIGTLVEGVRQALGKLDPGDRFQIVLFNNRAEKLTPRPVPATPENVRRELDRLERVAADGGTNLYAGLELGLKALDADRTGALVLVTDGVANVGHTARKEFLKLVEAQDVRLFTFVLGNSANRPLLEHLADHSNGFAMTVSNSDDIVGRLMQAAGKVTYQALHDIEIDIDGVRVADLTLRPARSLYRGGQLAVMGHYWQGGSADVTVKAKIAGQPVSYSTRVTLPEVALEHPELERLWAYATIQGLEREKALLGATSDHAAAIADLGLEYGLVTNETSMVVLREEVFAERGIERRNAKRRELERAAQQQRGTAAPVVRRADSAQPMFRGNSADVGSGSTDLPGLLLVLIAAAVLRFGRRSNG